METQHQFVFGDARSFDTVERCELVVTSPPYPMIAMWDSVFASMNPAIADALDAGAGERAFELMHSILDTVWENLAEVVVPGGIVCLNIGDATRTVDGVFRSYQNHARIITGMQRAGFETLPDILWRKPTNSAAKFMGSGMLPPNAYVTLEHEYVLVFRKGPTRRTFAPKDPNRYQAAYFWEERNSWFSDLWNDVRGVNQDVEMADSRDRTAAFPLEIPYRLISMFSIYGDTILDPFAGTGTTALAAMMTGRNSVSVEIDQTLESLIKQRVEQAPALAAQWNRERLAAHEAFVSNRREHGDSLPYTAEEYDMPVRTAQEERIRLYGVAELCETDVGYRATHELLAYP